MINDVPREARESDEVSSPISPDARTLVSLRAWHLSDAGALIAATAADPDLAAQFGGSPPATMPAAEAFIHNSLASSETSRNWALSINGVAQGNIAITHIEHRHDTAWVSYWLAAGARGQGLAAHAVATAAEWAFRARGLHRLELGHRVNNPASCRVAERAGFTAEGIERDKLRYGTDRFDVETHARLATDPAPYYAALAIS